MKRIPVLLLLLFVVVACGFAAWFALSEEPGAPVKAPAAPATGVTETDESTAEAVAQDPTRRRVGSDAAGVTSRAAANTVAGRVLHGEVAVAGATIEAFAAPGGDYDEALERAREFFGEVFSRDELETIQDGFGGFGGRGRRPRAARGTDGEGATERPPVTVAVSVDPDGASTDAPELEAPNLSDADMSTAMDAGRTMVGRMLSNPGFMEKALDFARLESAGFQHDAAWPMVGRATSGPDGAFRIENLPDGQVELRIRAPGFQRQKLRVAVGKTGIQIDLQAAGVLTGIVTSGGQPVVGASVRTKTTTLTTDGRGGFRLDGAVTPKESLLVSATGYVPAGRSVAVATEDETTVEIELEPAAIVRGVVVGANGAPIQGASVRTTKGGGFNPMAFMELAQRDRVNAPAPQTVTDANGRFELDAVPAGSIKLAADARGYLPLTSDSLILVAGESTDDVKLVLALESSVAGRVTGPDGAPVAGATVKVALPAPGGMGAMIAGMFGGSWQTALTADDGTYRVTGLHGGDRKVRVESSRYLHSEADLTLPEGETVTYDVALRPGFMLSGLVLAPDGNPVAGANVAVKWPDASRSGNPMAAFMGGLGDTSDATTKTDAEGRYAFDGLQEGPYEVTASDDDYLDASATDQPAGATDVVLQLRAACRISGVALDENGTALGGVWVHLDGGRRRGGVNPMMAMFTQGPRELTDASGRFTHAGLEPGKYTVYARRKGWAESERIKVELSEGQAVDDLTVALRAGATLSGRVVTRGTGEPVPGALVYVPERSGPMAGFNPMDAIEGEPQAPPNSIDAKADADGRFELTGLTPGKVTLEVRAASRAPASLASVAVPAGDVVVEMGVGGAVEGYVLDDAGLPQSSVNVILSGGAMGFGRQKTAQTDANGYYTMERIVPGTYQIMKMDGSSAFGVDGMTAVTVREGETLRKDFKPETTGGSVAGGVTRGGAPVDGAMVILTGGSIGMRMGTTDAEGAFSFDAVPPGEYTISVQSSMMGGGTTTEKVTVEQGGRVTGVNLVVSPLEITGRVLDAETGKAVQLAQVILFDPAMGPASSLEAIMANQRGQAFTDDQGRFTITGVQAGTFSLRVAASGYAEETQAGVAAPASVEIRLVRGAEFEVTVVGPDGEPISGATVVARDSSGGETTAFSMAMQGVTDSRGIATLRLGAGSYVLVAETGQLPASSAAVDASDGSVTIRLEQGGALDVVVRQGGQPVPGARVQLLDELGASIEKRISVGNILGSGGATDSAGRVVREGLPAGRVTVVVTPTGGMPKRVEATVTRGVTERVVVDLD